MGRVSRYKKVKSFDPYSKKNGGKVNLKAVGIWGLGSDGRKAKKRSRRSEMLRANKKRKTDGKTDEDDGFDLPPNERDEFDMSDLSGSVKKQKAETLNTPSDSEHRILLDGGKMVAHIPKTDEDEKKMVRGLKVEKQLEEKMTKKKVETQKRIEGESKRAYARRTKSETRQIIKQSAEQNPEKRKRKKDFLNKKKKSKKKGNMYIDPNESSNPKDEEIEKTLDGPADPEYVHFTEQVARPPTFKQLPRGAKQKSGKGKDDYKSSGMTDDQVKAERNAMELMRRKVQAQYALIKARRKRNGDFHL